MPALRQVPGLERLEGDRSHCDRGHRLCSEDSAEAPALDLYMPAGTRSRRPGPGAVVCEHPIRSLGELSGGWPASAAASRAPSRHGLVIAPGMLADALRRFLPLPLDAELSRHLAPVVHGDETGGWIRELGEEGGGNARARAWIARSEDAVRIVILPSRSAEAALFGDPGYQVAHLICDRYSAYRKLARIVEGRIVLAYCRVHARRDTSGTATRTSHRGFLRHGSMPGVWRARTTQSSSGGGAVEAFFAEKTTSPRASRSVRLSTPCTATD